MTSSNDDNAPGASTPDPNDGRTYLARKLLPGGKEPDPRFTLANERTFLAWTRTSLAFLAGGVAIEAFALPGLSPLFRTVLAIFVTTMGMFIAAGATVHWLRIERAMREERPLPLPAIVPFLSASAFIACILAVGIFVMG